MNDRLSDILYVELVRGSADVSFPKPVGPHCSMETRNKHIMPNIKLPILVEQRLLDIFLHNIRLLSPIEMFLLLLEYVIQLIDFIYHRDPLPSIRQLSRFNNPNIPCCLFIRCFFLHNSLEFFGEELILGVSYPGLDVVGERDYIEHVLLLEVVVLLQIVEHGLFVADEVVVFQVIVHSLFVDVRA